MSEYPESLIHILDTIYNSEVIAAHLLNESLVVSIRRQDELLCSRGSTTIQAGDLVTFMVSPSGEERLQAYPHNQALAIAPR